MNTKRKVAIVGAGISGLSTAHWLLKKGFDVTVFEAANRAGGYAGSVVEDGFVIETGPSSLMDNEPTMKQLIEELGLKDRIVDASATAQNRYIYSDGLIKKVPLAPPTLLTSNLLGFRGKIRLVSELLRSFTKIPTAETVFEFGVRHFGKEFAENILYPAIVGVFAGDAKKLSLDHAFPKMRRLEKEFGSLIRAQIKTGKSGAKPKLFGFKNGLGELIEALAKELSKNILPQTSVTAIKPFGQKWKVLSENVEREFDAVILSTSWKNLVPLVAAFADLTHHTQKLPVAPVVSLSMAFDEPVKINGFGILVHPKEMMKTLGVLSPAEIFEGRAPSGKSLLTLIMGGVFSPDLVKASRTEIEAIAHQELTRILGPVPRPTRTWLFSWPQGITQYNLDCVQAFTAAKTQLESNPSLYLNSHAFGGVSVADCIRKSKDLADLLGSQP